MANLMSGSYSYEELKKKYDDFEIPVVKVKVNGIDVVSTMNLPVVEMKMTLSMDAASSSSFSSSKVFLGCAAFGLMSSILT